MESLDLMLRKALRLNKMSVSIPPIYSLPILFPEWTHLPHLYRRSVHFQPGVLGALFNSPNLGGGHPGVSGPFIQLPLSFQQ